MLAGSDVRKVAGKLFMLVGALHAYRSSSCLSEGMVHHGQRMYTNIELLQYIQNVAHGLLLHAICVLLRLAILRREEHARNIRSKSCSNPSRRLRQRRTSE